MFVNVKPVISAQDMYDAVTEEYEDTDIVIMTAAVADYRPAEVSTEKVKKKDGDMSIPLTRNEGYSGNAWGFQDTPVLMRFFHGDTEYAGKLQSQDCKEKSGYDRSK